MNVNAKDQEVESQIIGAHNVTAENRSPYTVNGIQERASGSELSVTVELGNRMHGTKVGEQGTRMANIKKGRIQMVEEGTTMTFSPWRRPSAVLEQA